MNLEDTFKAFESYDLWLLIIGIAVLTTSLLPRILSKIPLSMPIVLLILGYTAVALPLGLEAPDPLENGIITEHLTELGVIIALMGAGLKIDRPMSLKGWSSTWRLLSITMILSIALAAFAGWTIAAFVPATAMLLGAVIAPTDPVLASDVQVGPPGQGSEDKDMEDKTKGRKEDEVRFALTSEAGLNDGLAFPFTNMAIAMVLAGAAPGNWIEAWLAVDVLYKLIVGFAAGGVLGHLLARFIFFIPARTELARAMLGIGAIASTLIIYGAAEFLGGYGFIATFIGACMIRNYERKHKYHKSLHQTAEKMERLFTAIILVALGGAIAGSLFEPLNFALIICAVVIVFLVRPVAGIAAMIGFNRIPWREKLTISVFGIRGIGSIYYLAYALNEASFEGAREIWALVALIIVISIFVHGVLSTPVTQKLDMLRKK
jgi:NhaP-type Na+/H+ or K+/H+ antiporter